MKIENKLHIQTLNVMQAQYSHIRQSDAEWEAIEAAKEALRAVEDNEPLTLEEMRGMDGEPIWYVGKCAEWCILRVINGEYFAQSGGSNKCVVNSDTYGKTWLAYRRKPEGGEARCMRN